MRSPHGHLRKWFAYCDRGEVWLRAHRTPIMWRSRLLVGSDQPRQIATLRSVGCPSCGGNGPNGLIIGYEPVMNIHDPVAGLRLYSPPIYCNGRWHADLRADIHRAREEVRETANRTLTGVTDLDEMRSALQHANDRQAMEQAWRRLRGAGAKFAPFDLRAWRIDLDMHIKMRTRSSWPGDFKYVVTNVTQLGDGWLVVNTIPFGTLTKVPGFLTDDLDLFAAPPGLRYVPESMHGGGTGSGAYPVPREKRTTGHIAVGLPINASPPSIGDRGKYESMYSHDPMGLTDQGAHTLWRGHTDGTYGGSSALAQDLLYGHRSLKAVLAAILDRA